MTQTQPGQTVRRLNFRDRQLILHAASEYAGAAKDQPNHKALRRLARLHEILKSDEVEEWYETLEAHHRSRLAAWRTREEERMRSGKLEAKPELPPKISDSEIAGEERDFVFSTILDSWVIECLKAARFPTESAKWVDRLYAKYDFKEE